LRILDLFCGAGGAAVGYYRAGFEVVGVDLAAQPNYPFAFRRGDALRYLAKHGHEFDAVHASPPCQAYTALVTMHRQPRPMLLEPVRELLEQIGVPYVIENVQRAPIRSDMRLCGEMFGLGVIRHRHFELGGWTGKAPVHVPHRGRVQDWWHGHRVTGPYLAVYGDGGGRGTIEQWQQAIGVGWTRNRRELAEAIPPAYTQYIGEQLIAVLRGGATVASP
jgi:hypothetical protein